MLAYGEQPTHTRMSINPLSLPSTVPPVTVLRMPDVRPWIISPRPACPSPLIPFLKVGFHIYLDSKAHIHQPTNSVLNSFIEGLCILRMTRHILELQRRLRTVSRAFGDGPIGKSCLPLVVPRRQDCFSRDERGGVRR